jgi:hypothetical protein
MPFIFEENNFSVSDSLGNVKFSTSRGQPHIIARISDTISMPNMTIFADPLLLFDNAVLNHSVFGSEVKVNFHSFEWLKNTDKDNIMLYVFYKTTLIEYTGEGTDGRGIFSFPEGSTNGRWAFSPGGSLLRVYAAQALATVNTAPFFGGLTFNVLYQVADYEIYLWVELRNIIRGDLLIAPRNVGVGGNLVLSRFNRVSAEAVYTDAIVDYVIYLGRTV